MFNRLESLGMLDGARVLDLFAGSGALGIEALSRGAASVVFVDHAPAAVRAVRANLEALGLEGAVHRAAALPFLERTPEVFDLALLDPPYDYDDWSALLDALPAHAAVIESERPVGDREGWIEVKASRYGRTHVAVLRRDERDGTGRDQPRW